ncbi:MAG TPA: site-2 protease family protein [Acidobacteriota bacterium]|nr:site-2 protease family protein [Acidobacteriota bacterium]
MRGFPLFKLFGIRILAHPSWLFIFFLVTWSLAQGIFLSWHPDWTPGMRWGVAIAAALLFFFSVLLHELAHSLMAKAQGIPVKRITLFLFGGVSNIEREPASPKSEFLISVVGPVTSIVLGFLFSTFAALSGAVRAEGITDPVNTLAKLSPLATLLSWLGPVNITVGIFNMIPAFPLDGGRILRSIIWSVTKNFRKSTTLASGVGKAFGWLLILTGVVMTLGVHVPLLGRGLFSGLWLAAIGWFLNSAATATNQQAMLQEMLEDVPVSRIMRSDVPVVDPETTVDSLINDWIVGTDERAFPVMDGDQMVGLVCLHDVRKIPRTEWKTTRVKDIMTPIDELSSALPEEDVANAMERLMSRDVRQIPVMQNGHFIGMLRRRDIVRWLQNHL